MKGKFSKNKKGDIPVTILVIGVFLICTFAILSFKFVSIKSTNGLSESIEAMEDMNSEIQKYYFYLETGLDEQETKRLLGIGERNYLEITKKIKEEEIIRVRYLLP